MQDVIYNSFDFYNFLKYIGTIYGFMHNDLHTQNNKLVLIDFGRSYFAEFMTDDEINNKVMCEFKKLNYQIPNITNINQLYENRQLFSYNKSIFWHYI